MSKLAPKKLSTKQLAAIEPEKLTGDQKRQMRIAIAKDVLKVTELVKIQKGNYLSGEVNTRNFQQDAGNLFRRARKDCTVCAVGACFVAHTRLFNKVKAGEIAGECTCRFRDDPGKLRETLWGYFEIEQLGLIETAFEGRWIPYCGLSWEAKGSELAIMAREFGRAFKTDLGRLRAIMKNVLRNDGTFVPSDLPAKR